MPSTSLPTLDDLATDSMRALKLSVDELVALMVRCAAAQSALSAALIAGTRPRSARFPRFGADRRQRPAALRE